MTSEYSALNDSQLIQLSLMLRQREHPNTLHTYILETRALVDGHDTIDIPQSHRALSFEDNHEGGHRLNVRIKQGAAWLAGAPVRFSVTGGDSDSRPQAERMEKFARFGEMRLARGTSLHRPKQEVMRDLFECGFAVIKHHPRAETYQRLLLSPDRFAAGTRIDEAFWRSRVDPLNFWWDEDGEGEFGTCMVDGVHTLTEIARIGDGAAIANLKGNFKWADSIMENRFGPSAYSVRVRELWTPDAGCLIVDGEPDNGTLAPDAPARILRRWRNANGRRPPFYAITVGTWPYHSPLDEMVQLTNLRNWWATMQDAQASGGIFRHWQLVDESTRDPIASALWDDPVPENILLDLSKPPPPMGPGKKWELAPFEMFDTAIRYQSIVAQHEAAGASVARLMGQLVGPNTAVGTADAIEQYARAEFNDFVESYQDATARLWEDSFAHIRRTHTREPMVVAARQRATVAQGDLAFANTTLEIRAADIVAEDVTVTADTRSRLAQIADYQLGRQMQNNGDIGYDRRVEMGLVPWVDDATEEKAAIYVDTVENMTLEANATAQAQSVQSNLGGPPAPMQPMAPPNITRGRVSDPRGTGVGAGADNIGDTALSPMGTDLMRA